MTVYEAMEQALDNLGIWQGGSVVVIEEIGGYKAIPGAYMNDCSYSGSRMIAADFRNTSWLEIFGDGWPWPQCDEYVREDLMHDIYDREVVPQLYKLAEQRINDDYRFYQYRDIILNEWPEMGDHLEWVLFAHKWLVLDWAAGIAQAEAESA